MCLAAALPIPDPPPIADHHARAPRGAAEVVVLNLLVLVVLLILCAKPEGLKPIR